MSASFSKGLSLMYRQRWPLSIEIICRANVRSQKQASCLKVPAEVQGMTDWPGVGPCTTSEPITIAKEWRTLVGQAWVMCPSKYCHPQLKLLFLSSQELLAPIQSLWENLTSAVCPVSRDGENGDRLRDNMAAIGPFLCIWGKLQGLPEQDR